MRGAALALALAALAACDEPAVPVGDSAAFAPPPAQVCKEAEEGLAQLRDTAALDISKLPEATVEQGLWLRMGPDGREQFARLLAYGAACAADDPPPEQQVLIRNEFGAVLMDRIVQTGVDMSAALGAE